MEGFTHTMVVHYRTYTGSRRSIEQGFNSYEEARCELIKTCDELEEQGYYRIWGTVEGEKPQEATTQEAPPQSHTHYKIVAKDAFGAYCSTLLPISEDLQAALDNMDEDLKLIDVYKVTMPFAGASPHPKAYGRLAIRTI